MFRFAPVLTPLVLAAGLTACSHAAGPEAVPPPALTAVTPPPTVDLSPGAGTVGKPTRLVVPAIGVVEPLLPVALRPDGAMETPDFGGVGWYSPGPRPGAAGPAVIVAHVHGPAGDDVFARLHELRPGDQVTVTRTDGATTFVVTAIEQAPKERLPYDRIWQDSHVPLLRLVTCGGTPDPDTGAYPDNTIVYARAAR